MRTYVGNTVVSRIGPADVMRFMFQTNVTCTHKNTGIHNIIIHDTSSKVNVYHTNRRFAANRYRVYVAVAASASERGCLLRFFNKRFFFFHGKLILFCLYGILRFYYHTGSADLRAYGRISILTVLRTIHIGNCSKRNIFNNISYYTV